ncbi:LPS export ABC transporter periplasmic protein LptC [Antarctobacter jejuensis]|uniref:LPS export ABC transporter periplasmic protein LptC n=1 Tax=Antarctobacter jejuensis TaxID=1439938 RepID=UPI003FD39075
MRRGDGLYSRVIAWLKILLPLAALTMLSTLFLLSRSTEPLQSMPFVEALQKSATGQQVSAPYFAGTTNSGDVLTMTARTARPDLEGGISADDLAARMRLTDGSEITLDAALAKLRDGQQTAHLSGGVRIESSQGYIMTTDEMISHFDAVSAESLGPVQGQGPLGTFEAGRMHITSTEAGDDVQMVFSGGVKLVYQPPKDESAAE